MSAELLIRASSLALRARPNNAQVMASSKEDFPAPLAPEMQARSKLLKSSSTAWW